MRSGREPTRINAASTSRNTRPATNQGAEGQQRLIYDSYFIKLQYGLEAHDMSTSQDMEIDDHGS